MLVLQSFQTTICRHPFLAWNREEIAEVLIFGWMECELVPHFTHSEPDSYIKVVTASDQYLEYWNHVL